MPRELLTNSPISDDAVIIANCVRAHHFLYKPSPHARLLHRAGVVLSVGGGEGCSCMHVAAASGTK